MLVVFYKLLEDVRHIKEDEYQEREVEIGKVGCDDEAGEAGGEGTVETYVESSWL